MLFFSYFHEASATGWKPDFVSSNKSSTILQTLSGPAEKRNLLIICTAAEMWWGGVFQLD